MSIRISAPLARRRRSAVGAPWKLAVAAVLALLPMSAGAHGSAHGDSGAGAGTNQPAKAATQPGDVLQLDQPMFWDGGSIATTHVPSAEFCDITGPCPTYVLNLAQGGRRLRVAIDTPERSDTFVVELLDANGAVAASADNSNQFNSEAFVDNPAPGAWTVRIRPQDVTDASFRLRAKLESMLPQDLPRSETRVPLLPNLRTVPPYEFGFVAPANPLNGVYPPDTINPPLTVLGYSPLSCTVDEMAPTSIGGGGAVRCLRFTSGPMNLGSGIYDMRFRLLDDLIAGTAQLQPDELLSRIVVGPMDQVIYYSDGSTESRTAGTYSFHPVHAHFHDDYVLSFELYKVINEATGEMQRVGDGTKSGFCPADQLFADWSRFDQGDEIPGGDEPLGNCTSPVNGVIGLSVGWGDVYRWQRPGMYVEFNGQGNGKYVVRSIVDENNHVLESNEDDNHSYAYVEVQGDNVSLIERGWGDDPWDAKKEMFSGPGPVQRASASGVNGSDTPGSGSSDTPASSGGALSWPLLLPQLVFGLVRRRKPVAACV
jgi:hypothetical protein